jgi:glycosyltransferase involved in cell wall biosynthesis
LPNYYAAAQVYLHSGRAESFGLAVLEGSAAGLPVVAADEGGPREIIAEGETGFLVPATAQNFAEKLAWLLLHPSEAAEMGQRGAAQVRHRYTWAQGAARFVEALAPHHL